jgi:DNA-binding transcriptional MerR regulator
MECYICHRNENEFKKIFAEKLIVLEDEIKNLNEELNNLKDKFAKEKGFTEENKQMLKNIDNKYLTIKYNSYLENRILFSEMENRLPILEEYYNEFNNIIRYYQGNVVLPLRNKHTQEITFNDILESYVSEPFDFRIEKQKKELENKIETIVPYIEKIKETHNFFFEMDTKLNTLLQELGRGDWNSVPNYHNIGPNIFLYVLKDKIYLCPYCAALINGASRENFELRMAEEQKRRDWDDD